MLLSRWRQKTVRLVGICALCALCIGIFSHAQPEGKRIIFYAAQTSYSLPVADRTGGEFVGLLEALEPLGAVSAKVDGNKWKLRFRDVDVQFEHGKTKGKVHGKSLDLAAAFILENGRGLIPLRSLKDVLPPVVSLPVEVQDSARRVFLGVTSTQFVARRSDTGKVTFTFTAPVNPFIATEPGRLRMVFNREPVRSGLQTYTFDDRLIANASYSETNGAAELTVLSQSPLLATFSDDRKTITVAANVPAPTPQITQQAPAAATAAPAPIAPPPRPRIAIILDPAHGGNDAGAALSEKVSEKEVTLALARRIRRDLEARGIGCAITRDADVSVSMEQRATSADASTATVYVALHASTVGTGVRSYTAMVPPQPAKPLLFVRPDSAHAPYVSESRAFSSTVVTELLKRDMPATSLPGTVAPLKNLGLAAIAIEVAPPARGSASDLSSASYQQSIASALGAAIATAHNRQVGR
ncbi:MAG TPA: N-acetylmuramoyl-L-alanine amidase [Terriglobales bacterium]|nr:N-acetylmuramoyl-L-alanine amidase [Terriglobales bacterium]